MNFINHSIAAAIWFGQLFYSREENALSSPIPQQKIYPLGRAVELCLQQAALNTSPEEYQFILDHKAFINIIFPILHKRKLLTSTNLNYLRIHHVQLAEIVEILKILAGEIYYASGENRLTQKQLDILFDGRHNWLLSTEAYEQFWSNLTRYGELSIEDWEIYLEPPDIDFNRVSPLLSKKFEWHID